MSGLDDLPALREVVAAHDLGARKSLGQHFLFDLNLTAKIARAAGPLDDAAFLEVGPGPGGLTRALLREGAQAVVAIEADARFLPALEAVNAASGGRLSVIHADALAIDEAALMSERAPGRAIRVAANLPYNIGTALVVRWLAGPRWWTSITVMLQKEVAERLTASAGEDAYGRLAVLAALRSAPRYLFEAPARAFTPPPKVTSAIVRFDPRPDPFEDVAALEAVTEAAFGQRRKMLRASLKAWASRTSASLNALLEAAGVDPQARPETLEPSAFVRLATAWRAAKA